MLLAAVLRVCLVCCVGFNGVGVNIATGKCAHLLLYLLCSVRLVCCVAHDRVGLQFSECKYVILLADLTWQHVRSFHSFRLCNTEQRKEIRSLIRGSQMGKTEDFPVWLLLFLHSQHFCCRRAHSSNITMP